MKKVRYQAFISSTYEDLKEERMAVAYALLENDCFPAGMELFEASNKSQWDIIKRVIDESDFYILIIAGRYGSTEKEEYVDENGKVKKKEVSYTEKEFDYALANNKPIITFIHSDYKSLPHCKCENSAKKTRLLENFQEKARNGREIRKWNNKDNLKASVVTAITKLIADEDNKLKGWIPFDQAVHKDMKAKAFEKLEMTEKLLKDTHLAEEKAKELQKKAEKQILDSKLKVWELESKYEALLDDVRNYKDSMESFYKDCLSNPSYLTNYPRIISKIDEEREKRELSRLIDSYEMTYAEENGIYSINQDEPFSCHFIPEAREYAFNMLSTEKQKKARQYGLL